MHRGVAKADGRGDGVSLEMLKRVYSSVGYEVVDIIDVGHRKESSSHRCPTGPSP
jgi:hypothetical protein